MRKFFLSIVLLLPMVVFASEEPPHCTLESLEKDLDLIRTLEADFVQNNSDGTVFRGKLFLKRPGKLKFVYKKPENMVIVSDGVSLIYFDPSSHQATYLSLENSPASLLLDDHLDFRSHASLISFHETKTQINICMQTLKTRHKLTLFIDPKERILKGWKTKDPQGNEVEILFSNIKRNPVFCDDGLFVFKKPKRARKHKT